MLSKIGIASTVCVLSCSLSLAAEPANSDTVLRASTADATPTSSVLNSPTNNADGSVRVAARPKFLDFGKKEDAKISIPEPKLSFGKDDEEDAKAKAKKIESTVDRRMQSLERSLKREEKRLESRLEELGRRREKALQKGEVDSLERIQKAEKQAVADYDRRIERLLSAISKSEPAAIQRSIGSKASSISGSKSSSGRSSIGSGLSGSSSFAGSRSTTRRPSSRSTISPLTKQPSPLNPPVGRRAPSWNRSQPSRPTAKSIQSPIGPKAPKVEPQRTQQKRRFKLWPFR